MIVISRNGNKYTSGYNQMTLVHAFLTKPRSAVSVCISRMLLNNNLLTFSPVSSLQLTRANMLKTRQRRPGFVLLPKCDDFKSESIRAVVRNEVSKLRQRNYAKYSVFYSSSSEIEVYFAD